MSESLNASEVVLVLFSGGKDSFLAACREILLGRKVVLISFNSGSIHGEDYLRLGANRIIKHYGQDVVTYAGCYGTAATVRRFNYKLANTSWKELASKYPNITNCQMTCFNCQTAMWISALAYAKAYGIHTLAAGYKFVDEFCTGSTKYMEKIAEQAGVFDCIIDQPVWDSNSLPERDLEMIRYGFEPAVLEPKCMLGLPAIKNFSLDVEKDMLKYFDDFILPNFRIYVEELIRPYAVQLPPKRAYEQFSVENINFEDV